MNQSANLTLESIPSGRSQLQDAASIWVYVARTPWNQDVIPTTAAALNYKTLRLLFEFMPHMPGDCESDVWSRRNAERTLWRKFWICSENRIGTKKKKRSPPFASPGKQIGKPKCYSRLSYYFNYTYPTSTWCSIVKWFFCVLILVTKNSIF